MRIARLAVLPLLWVALTSRAFTQPPASPTGPTFDVVSIKLNTIGNVPTGPPVERPDGGLRMTSVPVSVLIARAYPPAIPLEMVGLPDWAKTERYDVIATSTLSSATRDDRIAMLRAMLADRFKLVAHARSYRRSLGTPRLRHDGPEVSSECNRTDVPHLRCEALPRSTTDRLS